MKLFPQLLILAGGQSQRLGQPKGLYPYKGQPWLFCQEKKIKTIPFQKITIVVGSAAGSYKTLLQKTDWILYQNPTPELGPFSSLITGLKNIEDSCYVLPLDTPVPQFKVWEALWKNLKSTTPATLPVFQNKGGHPVLLNKDFISTLKSLDPKSPDARLDIQLKQNSYVTRVEVQDPLITWNLNTPEDFLLLERYEDGSQKNHDST